MNIYESIKQSLNEGSGRVALLSRLYHMHPEISEEEANYLNTLELNDLISEIEGRGWDDALDKNYTIPEGKDKSINAVYTRKVSPTEYICIEEHNGGYVIVRHNYEFVHDGNDFNAASVYVVDENLDRFNADINKALVFNDLEEAKDKVDHMNFYGKSVVI